MALIKRRAAARTPSASKFKYQARTAEEVKQRANRPIGNRDNYIKDGIDFFQPKKDDNTIRVLPPTWEGARHYGLDVYLHYGIGPDESAYLCLDKMRGEACPLCEERATASGAGEEELAKALQPKGRVLVWVIDRKDEGKGPLLWSMPAGLDKDMVNCAIDKSTGEILTIDDPSENGYDVSFKREGEGIKTKYTGIQVARKASPLSDDGALADKWLQYISDNPLDQIVILRSYEELSAAYAGTTVRSPEERAAGSDAKSGDRPKVPARGATTAAKAPAAETASAGAQDAEDELPTWKEVHDATEEEVTELVEAKLLAKEAEADDTIDSLDKLKDWVCKRLGIEPPAATPAAGKSWKDRLKDGKK